MPLTKCGATDEHCREVIARAVDAGRAPATIQNIGALLASLANHGHRRRWLPPSARPMEGVEYTAKAIERNTELWVPPSARPTTAMVDALVVALDEAGIERGLPWLGQMARVAAFAGTRLGEQTALQPHHYDVGLNQFMINQTWRKADDGGLELSRPKNGRPRRIDLPGSLRDEVARRAAEVRALIASGVHGALMYPGPKGPDRPLTESEFRRVFIAAARQAGWAMVGDHATKTGLLRGGRPAVPYRNLRHHAAMWMREVAGFEWADVSRALGHHSVVFTISRYVRPDADAEERNRRRLEKL